MPSGIQTVLRNIGTNVSDVLLSIVTDINALGEYDHQWLVVTCEKLFIFDPIAGKDPIFSFSIDEIQEFRITSVVGSGLLQVRVDHVWLDLMRFSNRLRYTFDRALKRLWQVKRRETITTPESDERDPQRCGHCGLMLEFAGEVCPRCINHGAAVSRVLGMLKPYWKSTFVMVVFLLVGIALDMVWPLLTRYLVDSILSPGKLDPPKAFRLLVLVVVGLAGVHIARAVVNVITGKISSYVGSALTFDIRGKLVKKLEELGLAYYSKQETGSLVGRIAYDTDAIQSFMSQITSGFLMQLFLVIISFGMMFSLEPSLALWAMVPAPLVIIGALLYWKYVHPHFQRYWDRSSKQAGVLSGILSGIRVVKAFAQEENEFNRFQSSSMDVRRSKETLDRTAAYFYPIMAIVFQVGGWIIWYVGGRHVLEDRISLGTLMAFFGYLSMFYGPLGNLTNLTTWLTQFSTQIHRIFEILDTPSHLPESERTESKIEGKGNIELRDVTFGYSRGTPILKNISLKIRSGEKIGIVGRSGSGKTSIINLMCRFYDVDSGQVLLDGVDIRQFSKEGLRSRMSVVLQEPFLFRGTLSENIMYGLPSARVEQVIQASKSANAHDFVMQHPLAYDSSVGERGQELSGGERQRISVARAFLCSPSILILDEPTSSIDSESEFAIQLALDEIVKDRTSIIIAHRLSTLQNCDRIYVVENGQIVEVGNHRDLIKQDNRYASWVRIQQGKNYIEMDSPEVPSHDRKSHHIRWLRPALNNCYLGPRNELQFYVHGEGVYRGVFALRCFPIHYPHEYISLRLVSERNNIQEVGIIRDLSQWPASVQNLIRESLNRRYFFHTIDRIYSMQRLGQFLAFSVGTDQGKQEFMMRYNQDSAQDYGKKGKLLMDVEDNLYIIPSVQKMGITDRAVFNRYIYW